MAINLSKIATDLSHKDPQIQTFALISVTRLSPTLVDDSSQVRGLAGRLDELIRSDNPDVVFLARKASNHLRAHFRALLGDDGGPRPAGETDPARMSREELLAAAFAPDVDPMRLASLVVRLVDKGRPEDLDRLAPLLKHANDRVRSNTLEVFVRHGNAAHVELVRPLASDPSNRVRGTALLALDRLGGDGVPEALIAMLQLPAISMRETAVWVLSQVDKPWASVLLVKALEDPYDGIRLRAVRALAKYPTKESVRALKTAANDMDINICEAAAESLRSLKVLIQNRAETAAAKGSEAPAPAAAPAAAAPAPAAAEAAAPPVRPDPAEARGALHRELGTAIYQLCRLNLVTHERLDASFYEILRYQDFLRAYLVKRQKAGAEAPDAPETIRQLQGKITQSFVELGRIAEELVRTKAIKIPADRQAEVDSIMSRLAG